MWRFVLRENIRRFEALMAKTPSKSELEKLAQMLDQAHAELEELERASTPERARQDGLLKSFSDRAVDETLKRNSAQFSTLQIYDDTRDHLIILAQRNFRAPFLHHLERMRPGDGSACGRCLASHAPAAVEDVRSDEAFRPHLSAALDAGFEAVHAAPVIDIDGSLIAVLSTYFTTRQHFSKELLEQMASYAASIGPGLHSRLDA